MQYVTSGHAERSRPHRSERNHRKQYVVLGVAVIVALTGVFGTQAVQASQAASAQEHSIHLAQSKLAKAVAAQNQNKVEAAGAAITAAIDAAAPTLAAAASKVSPGRLTDAIGSAKTLVALQSDDLPLLKAAAIAVKDAQDQLAAEIVKFDSDQAAEAIQKAVQKTIEPKKVQMAAPARKPVSKTVQTGSTVSPPTLRDTAALLAQAQKDLDTLGGGDVVSLDPAFSIQSGCRAHAFLGEPKVIFDHCNLDATLDGLSGLMAHEWVHTKTSPFAILPDSLAPAGVAAVEMVADCYAMAKLGARPAPGGYMPSCTPEQTAASIAVVEHPTFGQGTPATKVHG
jgi:predicted negative regulator of RcsB-dependent stress response